MKSLFYSLLLLPAIIAGCQTVKNNAAGNESFSGDNISLQSSLNDYSDPSTWILGYFNKDRMLIQPHSGWFIKGYDEYVFNSESVNSLMEISKDGLSIKIVLSSWCPDSRREVPRFMRILDVWRFPLANVTFIGVDNIKQSPVGEYDKLDIERVPTFIIYKNNIEAGRIIENPVTSLEQDLVNILKQE